jgi:hypothetical protein
VNDPSPSREEETPPPEILRPETLPARWRDWAPFLSKLALELFVVFVGVTAAFAVENYRDAREQDVRRAAVYRALDRELKQMAETRGPLHQREMTEQLAAWDQAVAKGERPVPPTFRLPEAERPPTGVWDAAVATGSIELVEPDLFFELARFYNRADSVGTVYQRYVIAAETDIWPRVDEGPTAFWEPDGTMKVETRAHVQRLRDFRERQRKLDQEAALLREKLRASSQR